jgi:hypothetical protein
MKKSLQVVNVSTHFLYESLDINIHLNMIHVLKGVARNHIDNHNRNLLKTGQSCIIMRSRAISGSS